MPRGITRPNHSASKIPNVDNSSRAIEFTQTEFFVRLSQYRHSTQLVLGHFNEPE